jgi:MmyB-like transcription regulator ligand binding domain
MTARAVPHLRSIAGADTGEARLAELVGELSLRSERFRTLWARQDVKHKTTGTSLFNHPQVGPLELNYEKLLIPGSGLQALVTYHAQPGSESEEHLRLLASISAPGAVPGSSPRPGPGERARPRAKYRNRSGNLHYVPPGDPLERGERRWITEAAVDPSGEAGQRAVGSPVFVERAAMRERLALAGRVLRRRGHRHRDRFLRLDNARTGTGGPRNLQLNRSVTRVDGWMPSSPSSKCRSLPS